MNAHHLDTHLSSPVYTYYRVNCSFYFKIGACRHWDRCSKKHVKPTFSLTLVVQNVYRNPSTDPDCQLNDLEVQEHFDTFYEDWWIELCKSYGEVLELHICDNVGEHLKGNLYAKFR